jgi:hypothetical protein
MTKTLVLGIVSLLFVSYSAVLAQMPGPDSATVPKRLEADSTTLQSMELERIKRAGAKEKREPDVYRPLNFTEIKKDFEQMQLVFDSQIVKTYKSTDPIDYGRISDGSEEIRQRAARLKANLFFERTRKEKVGSLPGNTAGRQELVKKLIIDLNEALRSLVTNPMFRNPKVVDPKDSDLAKADLDQIILLSSRLARVEGKQD